MKVFKFRLLSVTLLLFLIFCGTSCQEYKQKQTLGNPASFNSTSNGSGVNLLPSLDTNCGGSSCIR